MKKLILSFLLLLVLCTSSIAQVPFPGWGVVKAVPAGGYTFTYVAGTIRGLAATGTTIATTTTLNVVAGDTIIVFASYFGAATTITVASSTTDSATMEAVATDGGGQGQSMGIIASATVGATTTFTATFGATRTYRAIGIMQFRKSGGTVAKDDADTANGSSATATSGLVNTTAGAAVVGGFFTESIENGSAWTIGGQAATAVLEEVNTGATMWYRIISTAQSNITAVASGFSSGGWICNIYSAKAT